jgi:dolichyl-phosphate beta-glucosyltransferase
MTAPLLSGLCADAPVDLWGGTRRVSIAAMNDMRTIVVVPCFNEEERLDRQAFERFAEANPDVGILFVDDGSSDATRSVLATLCSEGSDSFDYTSLDHNRGKAEAVRVGVVDALGRSPEYVGYWDADLSTPLEEIPRFVVALDERPELLGVMGCRIRRLGAAVERQTARHYLGRVFATIVSMMLGIGVYDSQCGAKLFRTGREVSEIFAAPFLSKWVFDVELIARLISGRSDGGDAEAATPLLELPLPEWHDVEGSKLRPHHMLLALVDLLNIYRVYRLNGYSMFSRRSPMPPVDP